MPSLLYVFPTYADAQSALTAGDIPDGARVEVERDENRDDCRYRYDASVPGGTTSSALINHERFATLDANGQLVEYLARGLPGSSTAPTTLRSPAPLTPPTPRRASKACACARARTRCTPRRRLRWASNCCLTPARSLRCSDT